jgi:hypothetical protein
MSLSTTNNRNDYTATGGQTTFAYTFKIFATSDLQVFVNDVLKTLTTDYTVTGAGQSAGGNVIFNAGLTANDKVAIVRAVPYDQQTVYVDNDKFPASSFNDSLDKLTMLAQQLLEKLGRALTLKTSSTQSGKTVDDLVAGKHLRVRSDASGLEMADVAAGSISTPVSTTNGGTGASIAVSRGDLLRGSAAAVFERVAKGAEHTLLKMGPDDPAWATLAATLLTMLTTKGDLAVSTGATVQRKAVGANRTILEADSAQGDGVAWAARALGVKSVQVFTASGTWTRPTGIRKVITEVVGAGGGGGGAAATAINESCAAGGGGGGGYCTKLIDVSSIASATITIGAAGAAGAAGANGGGVGGNSSWSDGTNTLTANGGGGGSGAVVGSGAQAGAGGTATGGDLNITGQGGGSSAGSPSGGVQLSPGGGIGGSSVRGGGGHSPSANNTGNAGGNYGGGGSGGAGANGAARAGGAGAAGVVVVWEAE